MVADLRANGIREEHIYVLGRSDVDLDDLPDAGPECDDFLPACERGLAIGGAGGLPLMAGVPRRRVAHIEALIRDFDLEVDVMGIEPRAPMIPHG